MKTINSEQPRDQTTNNSAIIAGVGLLLMAILAPIANFFILQKLVVPGDAGKTFMNISQSEELLRLGICCFLIVAILDVIVAWALYVFLFPVNKKLSLLAAWLRIMYAAILSFVLIFLIQILQMLNMKGYSSAFSPDQLQAQGMLLLNTFTMGWQLGLIIFSLHLLLVGYMMLEAGFMNKVLGPLIIVAGLGYLTDGFGNLLFTGYSAGVGRFTFIGEVVLVFWLLVKGKKLYGER